MFGARVTSKRTDHEHVEVHTVCMAQQHVVRLAAAAAAVDLIATILDAIGAYLLATEIRVYTTFGKSRDKTNKLDFFISLTINFFEFLSFFEDDFFVEKKNLIRAFKCH